MTSGASDALATRQSVYITIATVATHSSASLKIWSMPLTMNDWISSTSPIARLIRSPVRCRWRYERLCDWSL